MRTLIACFIAVLGSPALAAEELISTAKYESGEAVPYILNSEGASPRDDRENQGLDPQGWTKVDAAPTSA